MRKFLGTFVIVSAVFAAIGVFRGWYNASADNQSDSILIELQINKEIIKGDMVAAKARVGNLISGGEE